jgi:hypothetical protein
MVRIGGVSYSWYLWHWPLLVFAAILVGGDLALWQALPVVALSYGLAVLSRRVVEEPFHHSPVLRRHPDRALRLGAVCTAAGVLAGLVLVVPAAVADRFSGDDGSAPGAAALGATAVDTEGGGAPQATPRIPAVPGPGFVPAVTRLRDDLPATYADGCHQRYPDTAVPDCVYGSPQGPRTVVLTGDSHAATWFPALEKLASQRGWRLVNLTKHACPVASVRVWSDQLRRSYRECSEWRAAALARIAREKPDLVVATSRTDYAVMKGAARLSAAESAPALAGAAARAYRKLDRLAGSVLVLRDNPMRPDDPVECLARNLDDPAACTRPESEAVPTPGTESAAATEAGVDFLDTRDVFCVDGVCPAVVGGVAVYRDGQHVGATYARTLAPYLSPVLARLLR